MNEDVKAIVGFVEASRGKGLHSGKDKQIDAFVERHFVGCAK